MVQIRFKLRKVSRLTLGLKAWLLEFYKTTRTFAWLIDLAKWKKTFPGEKLSSQSSFQPRSHHQQLPGSRTPPQAFWKVSQHYHQDYRLVYFFVTKLPPLRIELLAQTANFGLKHLSRLESLLISFPQAILEGFYQGLLTYISTFLSVYLLHSRG